MADRDPDDGDLAELFRESARAAGHRAPLYRRLGEAIADDPATARLLLHAPADQRVPVLLYACVHWILLREPHHELRRWYPNLAPDEGADGSDRVDPAWVDPARGDPYPAFREFCARNEARLAGMLATRSTQTNEIGRCALFLPMLAAVAEQRGPLALLDVGASAGLNLLFDRYHYRYVADDAPPTPTTVGDPGPVELVCSTRGPVPVPRQLPIVADRLGLDRAPIDPTDRDAAAWLQACVWPDQADRFARLGAALAIAADDPPRVAIGDAVTDLAATADRLDPAAHLVVTDSWALNYLTATERLAFLDALDAVGATRDLSWCALESPAITPELPWPEGLARPELTHLLRGDWLGGRRVVSHLGTAHPHGYWLHWR